MPNTYVNKVELADGTSLIDISDTTAVAADVASGKYFYTASGEKVQGTATGGGTPAISVVDTADSAGGVVRTITALDISDTTAVASDVASGKYFYTADGAKTQGSIATKTSSDLTASNLTVTAPSGYYHSSASKTLTDANLVAGNIKKNVSIFGITGSYEGSGTSKNTQVVQGTTRTNASALTAIGSELTVSKTGTYDIYYTCMRTNTSSSYTWGTQLYKNGTAYGSESTTWSNNVQNTHLTNVSLTSGDKLRVYGRETRGTSYYVYAPMIAIVEQ